MQYGAPPPSAYPNPAIPPGLEYLTMIDQLLVKQKVELLEGIIKLNLIFSNVFIILAFTGFETNNKYTVKNSMGQPVFYAVEGIQGLPY